MIKKKKNLVRSPDEYTRYYGNFRGVDFSSDHTQVNERRFAYSVNMYKNYRSGEGSAIETIPGFRRRFEAPSYTENGVVIHPKINGIHEYENINANGKREQFVLVHAGDRIYRWKDYPLTTNVEQRISLIIPENAFTEQSEYKYNFQDEQYLDKTISEVIGVDINGTVYKSQYFKYSVDDNTLTVYKDIESLITSSSRVFDAIYYESKIDYDDALLTTLSNHPSKSFVFNNDMYIIDGNGYYVFDNFTETLNPVKSYVPTCYVGLPANRELFLGNIKDYENEQKNLLSDKFIHTYIADGRTQTWPSDDKPEVTMLPIYDNDVSGVDSISVYGEKLNQTDYWCIIDPTLDAYSIIIKGEIKAPTDVGYGEDYAGIEVTFKRSMIDKDGNNFADYIKKCTICAEFDKRIFLSGNPLFPNNIWYCGLSNGREDPTYFGELDVVVDGVENAPITGLIPVADSLAALKNHARQDGAVYFHKALATERNVIPVTYPAERGLGGYGCLGACVNFLDDPIFISRLGVEAIGQLSVRLERAIEHRSTLIDSKLINLSNDALLGAKLTEWDGYLILLVDGRIFMADSRQVYQSENGTMQYEWYYLEGIGVYEDQYREYYYSPALPSGLPNEVMIDGEQLNVALADSLFDYDREISENRINSVVKPDYTDLDGIPVIHTYTYQYEDEYTGETYANNVCFVVRNTWDGKSYDNSTGFPSPKKRAIVCEHRGSYTGGIFRPAHIIVNMNDNLFFGTHNGVVCSFNFDQASSIDGSMPLSSYLFDNRTIYCGVATKMDNCDVPHLNKSTIKKSTVIKTKSMTASTAKVKIRTNKDGYKNIARLNSQHLSFENIDFSEFSFVSNDQTIFSVREKEKNWVEKQHWIYSDEYQRPFSIHYIAFRYKISGRIKE